jgi:hypothetical protein
VRIHWRTAWQGQDIVVWREDDEVDRLPGAQIHRVVVVHREGGDLPGDLLHALVQLDDHWVLLPAETGIAGRVHFERQAFWAERDCIFWVPQAQARLPSRLLRGHWWLRSSHLPFGRVPREQLDALIDAWPLEGPQTWEQRKWQRIADGRPFADLAPGHRLRA